MADFGNRQGNRRPPRGGRNLPPRLSSSSNAFYPSGFSTQNYQQEIYQPIETNQTDFYNKNVYSSAPSFQPKQQFSTFTPQQQRSQVSHKMQMIEIHDEVKLSSWSQVFTLYPQSNQKSEQLEDNIYSQFQQYLQRFESSTNKFFSNVATQSISVLAIVGDNQKAVETVTNDLIGKDIFNFVRIRLRINPSCNSHRPSFISISPHLFWQQEQKKNKTKKKKSTTVDIHLHLDKMLPAKRDVNSIQMYYDIKSQRVFLVMSSMRDFEIFASHSQSKEVSNMSAVDFSLYCDNQYWEFSQCLLFLFYVSHQVIVRFIFRFVLIIYWLGNFFSNLILIFLFFLIKFFIFG